MSPLKYTLRKIAAGLHCMAISLISSRPWSALGLNNVLDIQQAKVSAGLGLCAQYPEAVVSAGFEPRTRYPAGRGQ
ncbi:hypothetical protein PoB_003961100 [Plakobranchus ocellatus]|uniref:Uncharacterized protein n=1 Tax=Plakobranchus ocellatus TaxID=259542 RepID=A0AAV4APK6_9GAST|nr:hypothetical protein PoB_003961100 [Plakobranchus ocellatus]